MDLLKRAKSRARDLREQCLSGRAARLKDAVRMFKQRFQRQPEMPASLAGINAALDDHSPLPEKISILKKKILQREAEALAGALGELSSVKALHHALEERLLAILKILEALRSLP